MNTKTELLTLIKFVRAEKPALDHFTSTLEKTVKKTPDDEIDFHRMNDQSLPDILFILALTSEDVLSQYSRIFINLASHEIANIYRPNLAFSSIIHPH
ncbi:hypothetical protein [Vibrio methylphosphonaticus]|uniref:hypothetical protein n=1 Tax=Vibrio methylphosphonaticus TaxID=2946866 RepID=UPI00202A3CAC|nr:hypothetical protein [Vibrio methylphosphonaticus]MCL9775722.1 hypothetical protein [Vibrio methylphosphonaticus]